MTWLYRPDAGTLDAPDPVSVNLDLFDLRADPGSLEKEASAWRAVRDAAESADDLVTRAATRIIGDGWSGDTATSYDGHRRRVAAGMRSCAKDAGRVADVLDDLASVLRVNQELLTREAEKLTGVPQHRGESLTFQPTDAAQSDLVREAVRAANEIRAHVDEQLGRKRESLEATRAAFTSIADTWKSRTLGMMNLNLGMGHKNSIWNSGGTDHGDIGGIAQIIADQDVSIVTMQEVAGAGAEKLERELEARTGDKWTVYFGETKKVPYWSDGLLPHSAWEPFGNAVAVRHSDGIASSELVGNHDLTAPGDTIETPEGEVEDGGPRKAVQVKINLAG